MATIHPNITKMTRQEYRSFCAWLRISADSSIAELIRESLPVQQEALESFYADSYAW